MSRQTSGNNYIIGSGSPFGGTVSRFTIGIWAKSSNVSAEPDLLGFSNGTNNVITLYVGGSNSGATIFGYTVPGVGTFNCSVSSGGFDLNVWNHLAISFDFVLGGVPKFYKNGVPITLTCTFGGNPSSIPANSQFSDAGKVWRLGAAVTSDAPFFTWPGNLADFRVYDTVLSDAEIAALVAEGSPQPSHELIQWKLCANQSGVTDTSGHNNNGFFVGTVPGSSDDPVGLDCSPQVSLSGNVGDDGQPLAGVTMTWSGTASGSTITDSFGNWTTGAILANGNYRLVPSLSGYTFLPPAFTTKIAGPGVVGLNFLGVPAVTEGPVKPEIHVEYTGTPSVLVQSDIHVPDNINGSGTVQQVNVNMPLVVTSTGLSEPGQSKTVNGRFDAFTVINNPDRKLKSILI